MRENMKRVSKTTAKELEIAERQLKKDWVRITVDNLRDEIIGRGLIDTMKLRNSLDGKSGDEMQVITYMMYGKYLDMNVGRGRTVDSGREDALVSNLYSLSTTGRRAGRRAKKHQWYSRRIRREQKRLAELLVDLYGDTGIEMVLEFIPTRIELKM
jgi:hypothetical protein